LRQSAFKEERFILVQFQKFLSMTTWPYYFGLVVAQYILVGTQTEEACSHPLGKEAKREKEEWLGSQFPFQWHISSDLISFC
jgi:hypothetical protein